MPDPAEALRAVLERNRQLEAYVSRTRVGRYIVNGILLALGAIAALLLHFGRPA